MSYYYDYPPEWDEVEEPEWDLMSTDEALDWAEFYEQSDEKEVAQRIREAIENE